MLVYILGRRIDLHHPNQAFRRLLGGEELKVTARFKLTFFLVGKILKKLQTLGENKNVVLDKIKSYLGSEP